MKETEGNGSFCYKLPKKQFSIMKKKLISKSSQGYYIPPKSIQFTKIYKIKQYYIGRKWEKHKKLKKSNVADIFVGVAKFRRDCENLQGFRKFAGVANLRIFQGCLCCSSASVFF